MSVADDGVVLALGAVASLAALAGGRGSASLDLWRRVQAGGGRDIPDRLYHGTSLHRWHKIQEGGWTSPLIYLADEVSGTEMYRQNAVDEDEMWEGIDSQENPPVVLVFDTRKLDQHGKLMPDWDDMATAYYEAGEVDVPPEEVSWVESIAFGGTASYKGPLKEAFIQAMILE